MSQFTGFFSFQTHINYTQTFLAKALHHEVDNDTMYRLNPLRQINTISLISLSSVTRDTGQARAIIWRLLQYLPVKYTNITEINK